MKGVRSALLLLCVTAAFGCAANSKPRSTEPSEKARQYHEQGVALAREQQFEDALSAFRKAVRAYPEYGKAYYNMGVVHYQLDHPEEAIEAYRKAIEIDPMDAAAHMNLGNMLLRQNMLSAAIVELQMAVRIDPTNGDAHQNLAYAFYLARMYHRAWDHLMEMERLGISPDPDLKDAVAVALHPEEEEGMKEKQ